MAARYADGDIGLWDIGRQQQAARLDAPTSFFSSVAVSPDGQLLASGGYENTTISLWDVQTQTLIGAFDGHTRGTRAQNHGVSTIAFSPDGKTLASGSGFDCTVRHWDVAVRTEVALLLELDTYELEGINSVVFSPNGTLLASASDDAAIRMWDTRTLEQIGVLETRSGGVTSLAFQPDGKRLASLNGRVAATPRHKGGDMAIRLWEVESRKQVAVCGTISLVPTLHRWSRFRIGSACVGTTMAHCEDVAASAKEHARLWDIDESKRDLRLHHTAIVESIAFSSDSKTLACVDDNCIRLWDTRRKRAVSVLGLKCLYPAKPAWQRTQLVENIVQQIEKWIRRRISD